MGVQNSSFYSIEIGTPMTPTAPSTSRQEVEISTAKSSEAKAPEIPPKLPETEDISNTSFDFGESDLELHINEEDDVTKDREPTQSFNRALKEKLERFVAKQKERENKRTIEQPPIYYNKHQKKSAGKKDLKKKNSLEPIVE